ADYCYSADSSGNGLF
nr:immunoglobulin light chain junction region [Macaca mulatta]